jgi:hypothetical protein
MRPARLLALLVLAVPRLAAQDASAYVPLDHWGMPYVEHLIAWGALLDPTPLTRPLRHGDLANALAAADTAALPAGLRRVVRQLAAELRSPPRAPWAGLDAHAGITAATHARRDDLREAGPGHATVAGGLGLQLVAGPLAVVTHPYFDTRLKWDPDYQGKKDRLVAGRNAAAYVTAQWRVAELFFGAMDRNWGPAPLASLLLSAEPYSYTHFGIRLGTPAIRFEGVVTQLDDLPDTTGAVNHRYWVAHRLVLRPPGRATIALWEGNLVAGPDRTLEPWFANILTLGLLSQYDEGTRTNALLGADVDAWLGRVRAFASVLVDDIQIDDDTPGDREPPSFGLGAGAQGAAGPVAWTACYTLVSNLAYRTPNPVEAVMRRGVGLARNFADYDQVTLRASTTLGPGILVTPEATVLRQGQGDFRLPYPPVAAYDSTPAFHAGVVERTVRLAAGARFDRPGFSIVASGGVHLVDNAGHVAGASDTRFVGRIGVAARFRWQGEVP